MLLTEYLFDLIKAIDEYSKSGYIIDRANHHCEYCLIYKDETSLGYGVDQIIGLKHGELIEVNYLAYACIFCDRLTGSDIRSILDQTDEFIKFLIHGQTNSIILAIS